MQITILGAGAGGCATAAYLSMCGHQVNLYNRTEARLVPIREAGGLRVTFFLEGFAGLNLVTSDIGEAIRRVPLVVVCTTSNGHRHVAEALVPHLEDGQAILIASASAGSLEFVRIFRALGMKKEILLGETSSLPQGSRMRGPATVALKRPLTMRCAAFPAAETPRLVKIFGGIFKLKPVANVLDTGLNNPNHFVFPAPVILNYGAIERAEGNLNIMRDCITPSVLRAMDALDAEKHAVQLALGLEPVTLDELYIESGSSPNVYRAPEKLPPELQWDFKDPVKPRHIDESVPFGLVFMASLGKFLGVPTPVTESLVYLAQAVKGEDYWSYGRTVEKLGITELTRGELLRYLKEGTV